MDKITSEDIKALREYLDKLEALNKEDPPKRLTPEEWDEALNAIQETGMIPEKYAGRIGENEIIVNEEFVDGKHVYRPEGVTKKAYYDIAREDYNRRFCELREMYETSIEKVILSPVADRKPEEGKPQWDSITDLIKAAIEANPAEVLDVANLPNVAITDERYQFALTTKRNQYAYLTRLKSGQLQFALDENGELIIDTPEQFKAIENAKNATPAAGIDHPLLRQLFAATMKAFLCNYGDSITVSLPAFAREMNIDIRYATPTTEKETAQTHKPNDFFKKLEEIEDLKGVWQGGSFYKVFSIDGYNRERNELTFSSPWLFKIIRELITTPTSTGTKADGSVIWKITGMSSLMKASIVSARSKPTVEIITTLLAGLKQAGTKPDAEKHPKRKFKDKELVTYSLSFRTIIERTPLVKENLDAASSSNKTTLLQRYFCGSKGKKRSKTILQEYIEEYTFIPQYYKDFSITFNPPTWKTLDDSVTITHHGINGDFKFNNPLSPYMQNKGVGEV